MYVNYLCRQIGYRVHERPVETRAQHITEATLNRGIGSVLNVRNVILIVSLLFIISTTFQYSRRDNIIYNRAFLIRRYQFNNGSVVSHHRTFDCT